MRGQAEGISGTHMPAASSAIKEMPKSSRSLDNAEDLIELFDI